MESFAENKFIEIVVSVGEGISIITADRVKLKQILYNLISNAIKFTPEGGLVRADVAKEENIDRRYPWAPPGLEFVKFSIQDTGVGIGPEDKDRIFDEFEQANSTLSRKYGGAGLGLAFLDGQSTEEFVLCAERALALAIKKGGDRVEVYSREQDETEEVAQY
jgi:signal transduction histidine kinase